MDTFTVAPTSPVPETVGVLLLVMPSVLDVPVSEAVVSPRITGASGAVVSKVRVTGGEAALPLLAASVAALAGIETTTSPGAVGNTLKLNVPLPAFTRLPGTTAPL